MSDRISPVRGSREQLPVELVDAGGRPIGVTSVELAHRPPGLAHRAFSVILTDPTGRVLLQRRAAVKTRFAGRWANACCGHPAPDQDVRQAAVRRLSQELGVSGGLVSGGPGVSIEPGPAEVTLVEAGVHVYRAEDLVTGRVEHEWDHVLVGRVPADLPADPDPDEVSALRWADPDTLLEDLAARPQDYAPWLAGVLDVWRAVLQHPGASRPGAAR